MKKLILGILDFHQHGQSQYREKFGKLSERQDPDALLIACSDSRVVPNLFASTDPGDLFVVRNVGNMVPVCDHQGVTHSDESEAAAIEFSICNLGIKDIIICGHSECGAMQAILDGREKIQNKNLRSWLRHGENQQSNTAFSQDLSLVNQMSQSNVLLQMEHVMTYPEVQKRVQEGSLRVHGWWFELSNADVFVYDAMKNQFVLLDENQAQSVIARLNDH
ncbi:MAG: hypothetical protein KDD46_07185 [Bdellovibrionales bacterium]|nr:hypothetical protein [Bdellovibrionales bacterium]